MTWREQRIVTILSTILLILIAALLVVLGSRHKAKLAAAETGSVPAVSDTGIVVDQDAYSSLLYDNGATTLSFTRDETGAWLWDGNQDFPLDETVISSILDLLISWKPQQTLTDAETLENSGLDQPAASLTATTESGAATSLLFGKTTTDGDSYYVRLNGDESTVYIIADTLYKLMEVPIYDMCQLPEVPVLQEEQLQTITVRGTTGEDSDSSLITVLMAQRAEEDTNTTWRTSGANVTDLPVVQSLLEDVTALTITKCVDYNPSQEAVTLCGFDAPTAWLNISYTTESEAEETLSFTIGNRLPDGSGRYVRLGDDTTIYFLPTELLDPLMRVAAEGLEG